MHGRRMTLLKVTAGLLGSTRNGTCSCKPNSCLQRMLLTLAFGDVCELGGYMRMLQTLRVGAALAPLVHAAAESLHHSTIY